jgi:filamentous hemagglutinin family protein
MNSLLWRAVLTRLSLLLVETLIGALILWSPAPGLVSAARAQAPPPTITQSGLNTQVNISATPPAGKMQYDITGGARPGGGLNLFHSFGEFGVPANAIANFLNDTALPTSNILGRVTDGNVSNIFGTIQTTGFGNANLFLVNPAGFLFGPNATVNVGGMVAFTSADYLKLTDNARFNAIPNAAADFLLTAAPVAAFGFLGSNAAAIAIQGSTLQVAQGQTLSFVGGNQGFTYIDPNTGHIASIPGGVTMRGGTLSAPGGQINLASVASAGEILSSNLQLGVNVNGESFTSLGTITISQDARIDTAGTTGGTIAIRGGQLTITDGATIASAANSNLAAPQGSVTINGAGIKMTGSDVVISGTNVSVTGSKVTAANLDGSGGTIAIRAGSANHPGNVTVAQNALLEASGTSGGSITIRGGQLTIADATLSADTGNANGALTAIDIKVTGDMSITDTRAVPAITATTSGTGNAGAVQIASAGMQVTSTDPDFTAFALIDTHTSGDGRGGNVNVTTGNLNVTGPAGTWHFIDSGPQATGPGGNITITVQGGIELTGMTISTGTQLAELLGVEASGPAGNLTFVGDSLYTSNALLLSTATSSPIKTHQGGNITMNVREINMRNTQVATDGFGGSGSITITGDSLITDATVFTALTALRPGGGITFTGRSLELTNGSSFVTSTVSDFNAGDIRVTATDHVSLIGVSGANPLGVVVPSGFFSNSLGFSGTQGSSGNVFVTTPKLLMTEGRINTITETSGHSGNVTINAGMVSISGEFSNPDIAQGTIFDVGPLRPSGIFTTTIGNKFCSGPCGAAGNVSITASSLSMGSGSQIDSGTTSTGNGGLITINASDTISMSGRLSDGSPVGIFSSSIGTSPDAGAGGTITLTAGRSLTISDGASVSASSKGPANAGDISINAGQQLDILGNSSVKTDAARASGGDIDIRAIDRVRLVNSSIITSVFGDAGNGGDITIDPNVVVLQASQVKAEAFQGVGGDITITTPLFLRDSTSEVSAFSPFGLNGTVTIQSPTSNLSESLGTLPSEPNQAHSLLTQRCAALANGRASSFVVAGREQFPSDPGGWLSSPLAFAALGEGLDADNAVAAAPAVMATATHDTGTVSLRRLTPTGFLMANFAESAATGCRS